jgi:hypothetical protein
VTTKKPMTESEFRKLPRAEKAIIVAHDVIQQIRQECLRIARGSYLFVTEPITAGDEDSAKDNLCQIGKACLVCAKGALFLGAIGRVNRATVGDVLNAGDMEMVERLTHERIFTKRNLDLIECAFERMDVQDSFSNKVADEAVEFGSEFNSSRECLVGIMLNIIRNDGTFVPRDKVTQGEVNAALRVRAKT